MKIGFVAGKYITFSRNAAGVRNLITVFRIIRPMLRWRLLLGTIFIAALAALCWLDARAEVPGAWLMPLALVVATLGCGELLRMYRSRGHDVAPWSVYVGTMLVVAANALPLVWPALSTPSLAAPMIALAVALLLCFVAEMWRYSGPGGVTERIALAAFAILYVGLSLSFVVQLRLLGPAEGPRGAWGIAALVSLVATVKFGDTGAYTVGRLIGRHKMAPVLSPGKTLEGAAGALAFSCFGAWLSLAWLLPRTTARLPGGAPWWGWIAFGLLVGAAGMLGDLAESLLKRDAGFKDSSAWMPGFGGVLDILDSILLAAPVAYACWICGLAGV